MMSDNRIRFGAFDFDPSTRELRRDGTPVRLQPQPAQVLACLLARPGEIVTRDELQSKVWSEGTFVDFDRSLNYCVAQVRSALGDSSGSPRYVRTLPKRGYQFIAPVSAAASPESSMPLPPVENVPRGRRKLLILLAAVLAVAALFLFLPYKVQSSPTRIAVARFDNLTGDPEFDRFTDALTGAVVAELTAWGEGKYAVVGNAAILRQTRNQRDLLAIHSALDVSAVVLGEVQKGSEGIHVFAQLIGLPDQSHRKAIQIRTAESDAVQAQSELARRILADLAQPLTLTPNR